MIELTIYKNDAGQRLDKFLKKHYRSMPMGLMYRYIRQKKIKINGKRAMAGQMLVEGDTLKMWISEDFTNEKTPGYDFMNLRPNIDILYEDENILLVEKPKGVLVHSDDRQDTNTLIDHIKAYLYKNGGYDPLLENSFAPSLCNRIDRNTAGIVIAAKNAEALRIMNEKIKRREISKYYLCACHGSFERSSGRLQGWMIRNHDDNTVRVYEKKPGYGDPHEMITEYEVLSEKNGLSLCRVRLITGRTHQIRAHMSYIGHPLLGDGKYGHNRADAALGYKTQALYSYKLVFDFTDDSGILDYLKGKCFEVRKEHIDFLELFD